MGGGKGGSSSQTVSIPAEVMARYNAVNARAENVAATPFTPYSTDPRAFVADLSSSQKAGIANINALQGMATPDVKEGQQLQRAGINTAVTGQNRVNAIDEAALQGISQAQQQGTAYNQAAGKNIFNAMDSAAPYMNQMGQLTQQGLGQGQQYLGGATDLTQRAIQTGQQYANQAQPYYTGALQTAQPFNQIAAGLVGNSLFAAQPLNAQAQQYLQQGTQAVNPNELDYSQYMNPYMKDVVQAQQALQAQENAQQRSALQGKAIQSGAFGGNRSGIEQANLARQQNLANQATMANLLQSGYGQAQAAAQQQQGIGLGAAQANRAAQQQAAAQAAALGQQQYAQQLGAGQQLGALGQQQYAQQLGVGQGLAALGQQQYGQALGTGAQIGQLGQQGYTQNLGAGAQLGQLGQNLYAQNIGQGQAIQGLGNQQFTQGLQGSQAAAGIGQNIFGNAAQTAGIQQAGGMNIGNLGLQNQAAQIAAAQAQMAAGQQQQQTEQAGKTALYNQFLQQQGYPFQIAQFLANIAEGTGALSGSTTSASRTGQRGGRMGDGYASGGLVPDSQGGAVYEPGLYGRGGYADGGNTTSANPNDYDSLIRNAYGQIGRKDIGTTANTIDQGGYDYWMNKLKSGQMSPDQFYSQFTAEAQAYDAAHPTSDIAKLTQPYMQSNADYRSVSGLNPDIASAFKEAVGKDIDGASARKYQDMLNAGMSMDQIKYNIANSQPAKLKAGDVDALKGTPLTYDAGKFSQAVAPVQNQYGAFSAGDFTPSNMTYGQRPSYGNMSAMRGGYGGYGQPIGGTYGDAMPLGGFGGYGGGFGGYGGGLGGYGGGFGGYGQPSNYGMPNFGSSQQYGGAPDYAGAMQYGGMRAQYGMPQGYGMQQQGYGMPQQSYYPQQQQYQQYQPPMQSTPAIPQSVLDRYNATNGQQAFTQTAPTQDAQFQQFQQSQQQAAPTATGKGAAPAMGTDGLAGSTTAAQTTAAPQATGKGASSPQPASGKGASSMSAGGRSGFADGGRAGYAKGGFDMSSHLRQAINEYSPGDPYGTVQAQAAMFAGAPGASAAGYVPPSQGGAGQYKMLQPQASILPQQQSGIKEAIGMGTSIASLGEAGSKLYDKMTSKPGTTESASTLKEGLGNAGTKIQNFFGFGDKTANLGGLNPEVASLGTEMPDLTGGTADWSSLFAANGGRIGHNSGGRATFGLGGIPGLDDLKQGYAGIPGNEGMETPMSQVVMGGTKTPAELKAEMDRMSSGSGGMGGSGGGMGSALGTAASVASLGSMAFKVGGWMMGLPIFASGGRVGKAGGGSLVDPSNPRDQAMAESFDNLLQRYDNNPLLAAAAMDVGTKVVDAAIQKAQQTGGDITDFLPRRTQEYIFALSKAALGAHEAISRPARAAGGRTGYALPGFVDDEPAGLAPSSAMTMEDVAGGLSPEPTVQVAGFPVSASQKPDYDAMIGRASKETGIPADLLRAQITQESKFNPNAVGKAGEIGLTQVLPSTAKKPGFGMAGVDPETLRDPEQNILFGAKYLAARGQAAGVKDWNNPEEVAKGLRAYNGGGDPNYVENVYRHMGMAPPANVGGQKPVQVATATGLAPKTDAGPFETIGKKILPDAVPTDSSFWVPLIAGLGTMLASDKYRFSQRLGEGLVGGAAAFGKQQEFGLNKEKLAQEEALRKQGFGLQQQQIGLTEREVALKEAESKRRIEAAKAAAAALSGNVAPVQPSAPVPTAKTTVAPPSVGGAQPSTLNNAAPAISPAGGLMPPPVEDKDKTPATPIPSPNSSFWENVDPQSNPHNLLALADRFDQAAVASAEDPASMATYRASAQQYRAQASAIRQSGIVTMKDQSTASMPGFNEAKAAQAAALKQAELNVTTSPEARAAEVEKQRLLEEEKQRYAPFEDNEGNQWRRAAPSDTPVQMAAAPNTIAAAGEPVKASLDPKTARVNNVIPAPPVGGGIPQAIPPREGLVLAKSAGLSPAAKANDQKFSEEFPGKLHNAIEGEEAMQTVAQAFKLFNSNIVAEKLQGYALLAKATGMPDSVVEAVAGGDPAAMQRVDKEAVPSVIGILKEGASRFGQQEFMVTQKTAVASKTADPKANHALVGELMGKAQWNKQFLTDWDKAKDEGWRSPSAFFASWSQANPLNTYILSATKQIGNFRGMDLPKDPNAYVEGAIYVAPERFGTPALEKYFGSIGVKPGQLFKYNGPNNLQPIAKEDYYTAHLTGRR
jgi:soluble lytic murein transglycosylase-like protein